MPADFIIKTGDQIKITIPPPAIVPMLQAPVPLIGHGTQVLESNQPICLQGDELPATLKSPMPYTAPPFVTPGMGTLQIILLPTNLTMLTQNGKPIILKGATFQAIFNVTARRRCSPRPPDPCRIRWS